MNITAFAQYAGVSKAAVSRYFNGGYLSAEKRAQIAAAVEATGYRPSMQAQMLRTRPHAADWGDHAAAEQRKLRPHGGGHQPGTGRPELPAAADQHRQRQHPRSARAGYPAA